MTRSLAALLGALLTLSLLSGCGDADIASSDDASTSTQEEKPSTASLDGHYVGKIEYQGYEIEFDVTGGQVVDLTGRVLVDCGSGSEDLTIAPQQAFTIADGAVAQTITDDDGGSQAQVELNGSFSGDTFTGYVREVDSVDGAASACDTMQRTFTATRQ